MARERNDGLLDAIGGVGGVVTAPTKRWHSANVEDPDMQLSKQSATDTASK